MMKAATPEYQELSGPRRSRGVTALLLTLIALALFFRLTDLSARNLWTDEAWVALAVLKSTPPEVLAAGQSTPPFYLLTVWALTQAFGSGEAVLRALSLAFGLGTVLLFLPLARLLTTPAPALLSLAAVVFSPIMVYYSKELKQYSGDAFFAVLVLLLAVRLRTSRGDTGWLFLALAGILGLGYSHSLVFILPIALASLWFGLPSPRRGRVALTGVAWAVAFGVFYALFFRHQVDPELVSYWSKDYPDFSGLSAFIVWLGGAWRRYLVYFLGENGLYWGAPLLALGCLHLIWRGQGLAVLYLAGPLFLAFWAAALHRYPFMAHHGGCRLMLFSAPMLYLVTAAGGVAAVSLLWRHRLGWLAALFIGGIFLSLQPVHMVEENLRPSHNRSQLKPLVDRLEQELGPQDWVYVYYYAIFPFRYYFQQESAGRVYWGKSCVETALHLPEKENVAAGRPRRLWLIAGHYPCPEYMQAFAAGLLGPEWRQTGRFESQGAVLYRFESPAAPKTRTVRPGPALSGSPTRPPETAFE